MLVNLVVRSCECCRFKPESSDIIDIPLEAIRLNWSADLCGCGYFYQYRHYAVSFNKWQIKVETIKCQIESYKFDIGVDTEVLDTSISVLNVLKYQERIRYSNSRIEELQLELEVLGTTPIPDHLLTSLG